MLTKWLRRAVAFNLAVIVGTVIGMLVLARGQLEVLVALPIGLVFGYAVGLLLAVPALVLLHHRNHRSLLAYVVAAWGLALIVSALFFAWQRFAAQPAADLQAATVQTFTMLAVAISSAAALYWVVMYRWRGT